MRAAEPGDLPCLGGIGMVGEPRFAADDAGLAVEASALERHGDGGAGRAEGECLGGEGAGLLGGFGVGAVGVAPGALVAAFAVGAASSGGAVAVGDRARTGRGVHGAGDWAEVAALLWDGVTAFSPRKTGGVCVSANHPLRTRRLRTNHPVTSQSATPPAQRSLCRARSSRTATTRPPAEKSLPQGHAAIKRQGRTWGAPQHSSQKERNRPVSIFWRLSPTAALSADRFATFLTAVGGHRSRALALYEWNGVVSAALYFPLQAVEVSPPRRLRPRN